VWITCISYVQEGDNSCRRGLAARPTRLRLRLARHQRRHHYHKQAIRLRQGWCLHGRLQVKSLVPGFTEAEPGCQVSPPTVAEPLEKWTSRHQLWPSPRQPPPTVASLAREIPPALVVVAPAPVLPMRTRRWSLIDPLGLLGSLFRPIHRYPDRPTRSALVRAPVYVHQGSALSLLLRTPSGGSINT
jgi:hypothetical protein